MKKETGRKRASVIEDNAGESRTILSRSSDSKSDTMSSANTTGERDLSILEAGKMTISCTKVDALLDAGALARLYRNRVLGSPLSTCKPETNPCLFSAESGRGEVMKRRA